MASRSTVRTPVAVASAAAWLAAGKTRVPGGWDFGSETMFMPYFKLRAFAVQPGAAASIASIRQMAVMRQIAEPRHAGLELQLDSAGRAVALLADDDFGLAVHQRHVELPFFVFRRARAGLLVGEIIFLAEHEHHHVGVLLDRAGLTQVRQLRALVVAAFHSPRGLPPDATIARAR